MALMGYEMFRNLASGRKIRKTKLVESFKKCLLDPGPDIIVCDEGHVLRREKSNLSLVVSEVATRRRIVLTGTPLQNNLKECNTMISIHLYLHTHCEGENISSTSHPGGIRILLSKLVIFGICVFKGASQTVGGKC